LVLSLGFYYLLCHEDLGFSLESAQCQRGLVFVTPEII
jgi:hypothetical protein